jgi:hypothetical protein
MGYYLQTEVVVEKPKSFQIMSLLRVKWQEVDMAHGLSMCPVHEFPG